MGRDRCHDAYRVDKQNAGSFDEVIRGWNCLRKHDVDVNILCTIHAANADHPLQVYRFFRDELQAQYIQLIPIVERATAETIARANQGWGGQKGTDRPLYKQEGNLATERTVKAEQFGQFLISIFDEWVQRDVGKVYVTTFDVALGSWLGQHNACIVAPTCGSALGAGAQRRCLLLRPLCRARSPARQHHGNPAESARIFRKAASLRPEQIRHAP